MLFELALAADRVYMLRGETEETAAKISLGEMNFGALPMCNGNLAIAGSISWRAEKLELLHQRIGEEINAYDAEELG